MNTPWQLHIIAQNENIARIKLKREDDFLTFREVFELWKTDTSFIHFYVQSLISFDFKAFYWEHPAVKVDFLERPYECIILKTNSFDKKKADETAFAKYIHANEASKVFYNLGKDAKLIVPTKKIYVEVYKHLGSFIRLAPMVQIYAQFQKLGRHILEEIFDGKLIWLNTAGLGVIWLHIRLDTRPKYYKTIQYKNPDLLQKG